MNSLRDACMQLPSSRLEATFVKVAELSQPSTSIDLSKVQQARQVEKPSSPILLVCKRAMSENFSQSTNSIAESEDDSLMNLADINGPESCH